MTSERILAVGAALLSLAFIAELLRRGILREKYAAFWLLMGLTLTTLALFPELLSAVSDLLGVQVPANLLFFMAGVTLLLVSVQLSYEISRLENRTRALAEEVALLRHEIDSLRADPAPPVPQPRRTDPPC